MTLLRRIAYGLLGIVLLAAIIVLVMMVLSQPMPDHPFFTQFNDERVLVLAHQGGDGERPSNTLEAFQHAAELGVDVLEMDVHTTADGVIVVIHDDTVDRTTDGSGFVNEMTFAEIEALDAAYNWPTLSGHAELGTTPYRGQGITIPALETLFQEFPDYPMSIEIKQETPSMAADLCALIREYGREDNTIVPSFSAVAMDEFRAACPEVATAGVQPEITTFYALNLLRIGAAWQPTTEAFMVPETFGDLRVLTPNFVRGAAHHNVAVQAWTINTADDMRRLLDVGVGGLITDYPTLAQEIIAETQ